HFEPFSLLKPQRIVKDRCQRRFSKRQNRQKGGRYKIMTIVRGEKPPVKCQKVWLFRLWTSG
ncbi:MAG: hypothetical protein IK035_04305, partial [Firmicutes bacterium]|nr:hypothetical protein [Bacillota bacterium]